VAPGVNILSSVIDFNAYEVLSRGWDLYEGTSMASPHVAGAAALLLEQHEDWDPAQVKSALVTTASDLDHEVWEQGGGLTDIPAAIDATVSFEPANASFGIFRGRAFANADVEIAISGGSCDVSDPGGFVDYVMDGATLTLQFGGGRSAPTGFYGGYVRLDCGGEIHTIPWGAVIER
jgi:minor extracellular serine protease Vpr